jgi:hypothetical protein
MRIIRSVILIFFITLLAWPASAQRPSTGKGKPHHSIGSRKQGKLLDPKSDGGKYPYHSIGIKLGDPFALTYKFYGHENFSFTIDFGKAGTGLYNRYYREKFFDYVEADTFATSDAFLQYLTHKVKRDLVGEAKFLYNFNGDEVSPGLQLYLGVGWEWKSTRIQYNYLYTNAWSESKAGTFQRERLTMGPQFVAGIEYAYFQIPISAFLELEYFRDVQADPGWHRFEGGVGLRYIF